jgi:hypothetical protein
MYCGINCNNPLKIAVTSGFGSLATYGPVETACTSYRYFSLACAARKSKNQPSSNRPFQCAICDNIFALNLWKIIMLRVTSAMPAQII